MRARVLIVVPTSDLGGVSRYVRLLVGYFPQDAFELHVAAPGDGPLFGLLKNEGTSTHRAPIDYSRWSPLPSALRFRKFLEGERFDILHLHTVRTGLLGCLATLRDPVPIVYTGHGWRFEQKRGFLSKALFFHIERFICRRAVRVTFQSDRDGRLGIEKGLVRPAKVMTIPTQIDTRRFGKANSSEVALQRRNFGIPIDAVVVGTVARMVHEKDPGTFLRTAARLRSRIRNVYFLWVGDGELKDDAVRLACQLGVDDRFAIAGHRTDEEIPILLALMDVFLLTSRIETFPLSVLEAMAARRPVIASDVGYVSDVIRHGLTGWLFHSGSDADAARLVLEVARDREKRSEVVDNAHRLVSTSHASPERLAKMFQAVYEQAIRGGS